MQLRALALAVLGLSTVGCGGSSAPPTTAPTAAQVQAAQATQKMAMYDQLRNSDRVDLAVDIGADIVARFPGTPAAQEVGKTLPALQQRARESAEARRIAKLWTYQQTKTAEGMQYHASVYAKGAPTTEGPQRVTLFIRQHPDWGQSVYLMRDEAGFRCAAECAVTLRFDDGAAEKWAATIPPTGEPAMFIDKDVAFIARLAKSKRVSIDTQWMDQGKRTLEFEVAGLDASKLPNPSKKK